MADTTLSSVNYATPTAQNPSVDGHVLTVAHGDLGNANTSYFTFDLSLATIQWVIEATTMTIEVSQTGDVWSDQTKNLTGSETQTTSGSLTITVPFEWPKMRIKRVTTNATNAFNLYLTRGRVF